MDGAMATEWNLAMAAALQALSGKTVTAAWAQEMAFYGPDDAGHFADRNFDFIQANCFELRASSGEIFHFTCTLDDDFWAIWLRLIPDDQRLSPDPGEGWFRTRSLPEFPTGEIGELRTDAGAGNGIQEIRFTVDGSQVILRAGEVYENANGSLAVHDKDESVLVFLDSGAYSRTIFNEPVYLPAPSRPRCNRRPSSVWAA
jgi:hypothetical protein